MFVKPAGGVMLRPEPPWWAIVASSTSPAATPAGLRDVSDVDGYGALAEAFERTVGVPLGGAGASWQLPVPESVKVCAGDREELPVVARRVQRQLHHAVGAAVVHLAVGLARAEAVEVVAAGADDELRARRRSLSSAPLASCGAKRS